MKRLLVGTIGVSLALFSTFPIAFAASTQSVSTAVPTTKTYPTIPRGFNALTATDAELATYGLPPRPTNPAMLSTWENAMSHLKQTIVPQFGPVMNSAAINPNSLTGTDPNTNWAGYEADSKTNSSALYYTVSAQWAQPIVSNSGNKSAVAVWVGIGQGGATTNQGCVQAGFTSQETSPTATYSAWWEWLDAGPQSVTNLSVNGGDTVLAQVSYPESNGVIDDTHADFYLEDVTTGVATTFQKVLGGIPKEV